MAGDYHLTQDDELQILLAFCREATVRGRHAGIYRLNWILSDPDRYESGVAALPAECQDVLREVVVRCIDGAIAGFGWSLTALSSDFPACVMIDDEWVPLNDVFSDLFKGQYLAEAAEISVFDDHGRRKPESFPEE
jgi:hypothetical protein